MSALAEKMRKARESRVEVGGHVFVVRRPTDVEMMGFAKSRNPTDLIRFVVGWDKVREIDLLPGGDPHPAPFDSDACTEWLSDRSDLLGPVVDAVIESYQAHKARLEESAKN